MIAGKEQMKRERNGEVKLGFRWNEVDKSRFRFQRHTQYIIPIYISTKIYMVYTVVIGAGSEIIKSSFF